jgi:hypothetical protein
MTARRLSGLPNEVAHVLPDISGDCPQEGWRDVPTRMKRNGRRAPVRMPILSVRTALTYFHESETFQNRRDFSGLQDRKVAQITRLSRFVSR